MEGGREQDREGGGWGGGGGKGEGKERGMDGIRKILEHPPETY